MIVNPYDPPRTMDKGKTRWRPGWLLIIVLPIVFFGAAVTTYVKFADSAYTAGVEFGAKISKERQRQQFREMRDQG